MLLVTGLFSLLLLLLKQRRSSPLRLQVSNCSTFGIMRDFPSIAVFCSESFECFPGMAFRTFFESPVAIPVAPIITGVIIHFMLHIPRLSAHKLLYFSFFSASICVTFLSAVLPHLSCFMFSLCRRFRKIGKSDY